MSDALWRGVEFKRAAADYFLDKMGKELIPPRHRDENRHFYHRMGSTTGIATAEYHPWQPNFYFLLDAFLTATRSIIDVIQKCFGDDPRGDKEWKRSLPPDEIRRRELFQDGFRPLYTAFNNLPASRARNVTVHGTGTPPVTVRLTGFWGLCYGIATCYGIPRAVTEFPSMLGGAAKPRF